MGRVAVVLAGGKGTRLRPLTYVLPKPLIPVAGRPIIDYIIEWLRGNGFTDIIVVAKYLGEKIVEYYRGRDVDVRLLDSKDTADAVRLVSNDIASEHFLVSMGDVLCNADFDSFYRTHLESGGIGTIALKEVDNPLHYGLVFIDSRRRIRLFVEKPMSIEIYALSMAHVRVFGESIYTNYVNTGFYMFSSRILDVLRDNPALLDWGKHVFPYLLENSYELYAWIMDRRAYWEDVGRINNYKKATWDILRGLVKGFRPPGKQVMEGVYLGEDTEVDGELIPPVYVGRDSRVEEGASIGPYAVLGDGCIVKSGSSFSYSIAWDSVVIGRDAYIYDTILMDHVVVGDNIKISSSVIGSFNTVKEDIADAIIPPREVV